MTDGGDQRDRQIERLEGIVEEFGRYLRDSTPRPKFEWQAIGTILAIIGMLITVSESWAIMSKRLEDLEAQVKDQRTTIGRVSQIDWTVADVMKRLDQFADTQKQQGNQLADIHDTLMKLGLTVRENSKGR